MAPGAAEAHGRLGIALRGLERFDEALAEFDAAALCDPGLAAPHSEAAFTLAAAGCPAEAVARYRRALELKPDQPEVRWNLALLLLQLGEYEEGWTLFETRWALPRFAKKLPQLRSPVRRGEDIARKTLLVLPEQGFGDNIQFARFARLAGERGARVVLVTRPPVTRLFSTLRGVTEIRADELPLPDCDYHVPIMGCPTRSVRRSRRSRRTCLVSRRIRAPSTAGARDCAAATRFASVSCGLPVCSPPVGTCS
jgi:TPR repeat